MSELDNLAGGIAAVGVGTAVGTAIHPVMEAARQQSWKEVTDAKGGNTSRVLDVGLLARLVAQALVTLDDAEDHSRRQGFQRHNLAAAVQLAMTAPDTGTALNLYRRKLIEESAVRHALHKAQIEPQYHDAIIALHLSILTPGELAAAIHRGLVKDPGLLKGEQPSGDRNVEAYPVYPIDALIEAAGSGYDKDHLGVLVGLQGLPMGVIEAAQAYYRGILTKGDYIAAFNESNNRNEWADAVLKYARQIPTARDYIENALRGYRTLKEAQTGAARHGMSADDALLIFQNSGRPLNLHQITQALAWGGTYKPAKDDDPDPWMQAVLLGAVRPEYYDLQKHLKYNLPSAFFFRVLQQQGVLTEVEAVTWYERLGWPNELAKKVAAAFAKTTDASADPHVSKAQVQLWTATHRSYLTGELSDADATVALEAAGVAADKVTGVLTLWAHEANITRKRLTAAQIKSAYRKAGVNAATSQPWTRDEALAALGGLGYPPLQANDYLDIPSK
jgi:hypothetical protein